MSGAAVNASTDVGCSEDPANSSHDLHCSELNDKIELIVKHQSQTTRKEKDRNLTFKIVLMGDKYVGKTSIVNRYVHGGFNSHYNFTAGGDIYYKTVRIGNKVINLKVIDTAGQFDQKSIIKSLYRNAHGIMIVFDVTNERSFNDVDDWVYQISTTVGDSKPQLLLLGNKLDLISSRENVQEFRVKEKASSHGLEYSIVSARRNINIAGAFDTMIHGIINSHICPKILLPNATDSFHLSKQTALETGEKFFCGC